MVVPPGVAFASDCEIVKVSWNGIFNNGIEIGDPYEKIVNRIDARQRAQCQASENPLGVDCTVADPQGIEYMIADGIVVRIEATAQVMSVAGLKVVGTRVNKNG